MAKGKRVHQKHWFAALFAEVIGRTCIELGKYMKSSTRHTGMGNDRRPDKLESDTPPNKHLRGYRKRLAGH